MLQCMCCLVRYKEVVVIICFDCKDNIKDILDNLINRRRYKDYNELINIAIENLSQLESAMKNSGGLVIQGKQSLTSEHDINDMVLKSAKDENIDNTTKEFILNNFSLKNLIKPNTSIPEIHRTTWVKEDIIHVKDWLFGQYNRLLPAKISCRSLAIQQTKSSQELPINDIPMLVAKEALSFAKYLKIFEDKYNLERDDLLSIALPSPEKDEEKSLLRYANQFVVSKNSNNQLQGMLFELKLINYSSAEDIEHISLTQPGWTFSQIKNPILEDFQETPNHKFSKEEIQFLIKHIIKFVPKENSAFRTIIRELTIGNNTPEEIDKAIQEKFSQNGKFSISKSFLSTQRSGAISRMIDLKLIERVRQGIRVKYIVTDLGKRFFLN